MKLKLCLLTFLLISSIYGCAIRGSNERDTTRSTDNGVVSSPWWAIEGHRQEGGEGSTSCGSTEQGYKGEDNTGCSNDSAVDKEGNGTDYSMQCDGSPEGCSDDGLRSELWYGGIAVITMGLVWRLSQSNVVCRRRSSNNSDGHT